MARKWMKTESLGVYYREHPTRTYGVGKDKYYALFYKHEGKTRCEVLGWSSEKWTEGKASEVMTKLRENRSYGTGPQTVAELKGRIKEEREAEEKSKAEKAKQLITLADYWEQHYSAFGKRSKKANTFEKEESHFKHWLKSVKALCANSSLLPNGELICKCPVGLTPKQAAILYIISRYQGVVMSYADIAHALKAALDLRLTKCAVRELVEKLENSNFFQVAEAACEGILQGKRYTLSAKCCPHLFHIPSFQKVPHPLAQTSTQPMSHSPAQTLPHSAPQASPQAPPHPEPQALAHSPTLLKREKKKEEEEKESISSPAEEYDPCCLPKEFLAEIEKDFPKKWPYLIQIGFDYCRFLQAAQCAPDKFHLMKNCSQSLDFAEFTVRHLLPKGKMKTERGDPVVSPRSWIFGCFKKSGDFPRPPNYQTPEELAVAVQEDLERQCEEEACSAAFQAWRKEHSPQKLRELINYRFGIPPDPLIKGYFKQHEWPKLKRHHRVLASLPTATEKEKARYAEVYPKEAM